MTYQQNDTVTALLGVAKAFDTELNELIYKLDLQRYPLLNACTSHSYFTHSHLPQCRSLKSERYLDFYSVDPYWRHIGIKLA